MELQCTASEINVQVSPLFLGTTHFNVSQVTAFYWEIKVAAFFLTVQALMLVFQTMN